MFVSRKRGWLQELVLTALNYVRHHDWWVEPVTLETCDLTRFRRLVFSTACDGQSIPRTGFVYRFLLYNTEVVYHDVTAYVDGNKCEPEVFGQEAFIPIANLGRKYSQVVRIARQIAENEYQQNFSSVVQMSPNEHVRLESHSQYCEFVRFLTTLGFELELVEIMGQHNVVQVVVRPITK